MFRGVATRVRFSFSPRFSPSLPVDYLLCLPLLRLRQSCPSIRCCCFSSVSFKMRMQLPLSESPMPAKFCSLPGQSPDLSTQPILVIEVPRELCNPKTTFKYFGKTLDHDNVVSPNRWKCIGQILLIYTHKQQVCLLPNWLSLLHHVGFSCD